MTERDEVTLKGLRALLGRTIELNAKADGIAAGVLLLGKKLGVPPEDLMKAMQQAEAGALQLRLERVENKDPSLAAEIDHRPLPGSGNPPPGQG